MTDLFQFLTEPLQYQFMLRGIVIAILLGVSGGMLGSVLILRRMALMGDALAHSLLPGMGIAFLLFGPGLWSLFAGALAAGLITAIGSTLITRMTCLKEDAAFGAMFVVFFGVGVALISSKRANIQIDLMHFLFGNILGTGSTDLWLAAAVSMITVFVFAIFYRHIFIETFDPEFYRASGSAVAPVHTGLLALIVLNLVAALQAMGIVLALGLFLLPAVTAILWCTRWGHMLLLSSALAVVGSMAGLFLSYYAEIPSGPAVVGVLGLAFFGSAIVRGRLR